MSVQKESSTMHTCICMYWVHWRNSFSPFQNQHIPPLPPKK